MNIILNRKTKSGNRIEGELRIENGEIHSSLENAHFLIPPGRYQLQLSWSPKFKKMLPLLLDVPGRTGIRIHTGSKPEHSKGCILVTKQTLERIINDLNLNTNEKHFITVGGNI